MYRVYDKVKKCFVKDNVYLAPNTENDLYILKKDIFGHYKLESVLSDRYEWNRDIGLYDSKGVLVFEGDFLEARVSDDRTVQGVVTYATELSSYIILCFDCDEFFTLGSEVTEYIRIIGNVFEGNKEEKEIDNKTL